MEATQIPRVKICCISSVAEAQLAIRYGAAALGLVSAMPSGPGPISETLISEIARVVPPGIASFLLTSRQDAEGIIAQQRRCRVNTIQIVDSVSADVLRRLRDALPGIGLVQVIHVRDLESVKAAVALAPLVDAILLDSGNPSLGIKELGGTGRQHDWNLSRQIREEIEVPLYLAGGLKPDNVRSAIEKVGPFGLDVCSGLRTQNHLDESKVAAFFEQLSH